MSTYARTASVKAGPRRPFPEIFRGTCPPHVQAAQRSVQHCAEPSPSSTAARRVQMGTRFKRALSYEQGNEGVMSTDEEGATHHTMCQSRHLVSDGVLDTFPVDLERLLPAWRHAGAHLAQQSLQPLRCPQLLHSMHSTSSDPVRAAAICMQSSPDMQTCISKVKQGSLASTHTVVTAVAMASSLQ